MPEMFSSASSYDRFMGRWSSKLAPLFVKFARIGDGDRVLDVGCGTGSFGSVVRPSAFAVFGVRIGLSKGT